MVVDFERKTIKPFVSLMGLKIRSIRPSSEFSFHKIKKLIKTEFYATRGREVSYSINSMGIVICDKRNKQESFLTKNTNKAIGEIIYSI